MKKIDYNKVLSSEGVVDIITEKDIEGINDVGPIFKGDKIFTSKFDVSNCVIWFMPLEPNFKFLYRVSICLVFNSPVEMNVGFLNFSMWLINS